MEICGTIDTHANKKLIVSQKAPPGVIQERSVGLKRILNLPAIRIFCLQANDIFKVGNTKECRLPTLPCELYFVAWLSLDVLLDVPFQSLGSHRPARMKLAIRGVVVFLLQIKAVAAIQVADRSDGLCHDVKAGVQRLDRHATPYTCPFTVLQEEHYI